MARYNISTIIGAYNSDTNRALAGPEARAFVPEGQIHLRVGTETLGS